MNLSLSSYSSLGKRKNNEDSLALIENERSLLAVVADGLGGMGNGEFASQQAVGTLNRLLASAELDAEALKDAICEANDKICQLHGEHPGAMTTVASVWLDTERALAMHVGDTRIYQFRDGGILYQSVDHSIAQMSVMAGELKPEEIRGCKDRNKLFRSLGHSDSPRITETLLDILPGDRLLLCTDGFWEMILEDDMLRLISETADAESWLQAMRAIVEPLAADNNTAIAIVVNG